MKNIWKMAALAAGVSLLAMLPAAAQQGTEWMAKKRGNFLAQRIVRELDLSGTQRAQIKTILRNEQTAIQRLLTSSQQANARLRSHGAYDEAFVRGVAEQQAAAVTEAIVEREKVRAEIMDVLTPPQQQTFNRMTGQLREAFAERISSLGSQL